MGTTRVLTGKLCLTSSGLQRGTGDLGGWGVVWGTELHTTLSPPNAEGGTGDLGGWGGVWGAELHTTLSPPNDFCIKMGRNESHFNVQNHSL